MYVLGCQTVCCCWLVDKNLVRIFCFPCRPARCIGGCVDVPFKYRPDNDYCDLLLSLVFSVSGLSAPYMTSCKSRRWFPVGNPSLLATTVQTGCPVKQTERDAEPSPHSVKFHFLMTCSSTGTHLHLATHHPITSFHLCSWNGVVK